MSNADRVPQPPSPAPTGDHARRERARRRVAAIKGFYIHLFVFVLVVAGLVVINWLTGGPWWALGVFAGILGTRLLLRLSTQLGRLRWLARVLPWALGGSVALAVILNVADAFRPAQDGPTRSFWAVAESRTSSMTNLFSNLPIACLLGLPGETASPRAREIILERCCQQAANMAPSVLQIER